MTSRVIQTRKVWQATKRETTKLAAREVRVGVVKREDHPSGLTAAQLMAIHEYGSPTRRIPERSILRTVIGEQRAALDDLLREGVREASTGGGLQKITPTRLLAAAGRLLSKRMRQRFGSPALAPNVVDVGKRGPLLDTGALRRAIRYQVVDRGQVVEEGDE